MVCVVLLGLLTVAVIASVVAAFIVLAVGAVGFFGLVVLALCETPAGVRRLLVRLCRLPWTLIAGVLMSVSSFGLDPWRPDLFSDYYPLDPTPCEDPTFGDLLAAVLEAFFLPAYLTFLGLFYCWCLVKLGAERFLGCVS